MTSPPPPPEPGAPPTDPEEAHTREDARARRLRRRMRVVYDVPTRGRMRKAVIGVPLPTGALEDELLPKRLALPVFASDALSSVAYATEAALLVLVVASASAAKDIVPVSIAVAALLAIVIASYRQTVHAYPQGGGAYVVAGDQLGEAAGLIAAASLLVDYVLTVAVSVAAGILAVTSAVTWLSPALLPLSLVALVGLALVNLRGLRESGRAFALPTYGFIAIMSVTIVIGVVRDLTGTLPHAITPSPVTPGTAATIGVLVLLRAFASGCSALTGVEAIANGVQAFRPPQAKNAASTLGVLGIIAVFLFLGVTYLAYRTHAMPSNTDSVLSQAAAAVWHGPALGQIGYYMVQIFTFGVLVLAANTAFQGFPRLIGMMAQGSHAPRWFQFVGDRLVYSNGVTALAVISGILLIAFDANVNNLIHLYLLGVFLAFTLSQAGMVRFWLRKRHEGHAWHGLLGKVAINLAGAIATAIVLVIILGTKFFEGAWMVTVTIPIIVALSILVHRHYRRVDVLKDFAPGEAAGAERAAVRVRGPGRPGRRGHRGRSPDGQADRTGRAGDRTVRRAAQRLGTGLRRLAARPHHRYPAGADPAPRRRGHRRRADVPAPDDPRRRHGSAGRAADAQSARLARGLPGLAAVSAPAYAPVAPAANRGGGDAQVDRRPVVGGRPRREPRGDGQVQQALPARRCRGDGDLRRRYLGRARGRERGGRDLR